MESKGSLLLAVSWFLVVFSGAFLIARLYCKQYLDRGLWWDDYLLVFSWTLVVSHAVAISVSVGHGFGRHTEMIEPQNISTVAICCLVSASTVILASAISKISFILTLMRITVCCARHFLRFAIVTMSIMFTLSAIFMWVGCRPLWVFWAHTVEGNCWSQSVLVGYAVATCAYSAFLDLVLSLLPWKLTDKLQMVRKEKIGVAMSTSFGIFACAAAVVKCYYIPLLQDRDFSYDGTNLVIWSVVEPSVTIVGASIPMLRVLFRDLRSQGGSRMNYGIKVTCGIKGNCKTVKTVSENTSRGRPSSAVESVHRKFPTCEDVDSRSDKSILERATSPLPDGKNGGILQVSEIKVEYSTRLQSDSHENFEMEDV